MYSISMINTYNESSLHKTIKSMIAKEVSGKTEVQIGSYICDIVDKHTNIIEIQTKSLGNLTGKILNLLETHKVTIVFPLATATYIEYYDSDSLHAQPISRRKSPIKKNIYDIFDELMGCFPILLHKNFTLKVIEVSIIKKRIKTKEKVQSENKRRKFLKNWLTADTCLEKISNTHIFKTKKDYIHLLPQDLNSSFCVQNICTPKLITLKQAYKMIWTYNKMRIITFIKKEGRVKMYKIAK